MRFSSNGIPYLKNLKELRNLSLPGQEIPVDGLPLPSLVSLYLSHESVGDAIAANIGQFRQLRHLQLGECNMSSKGLRPILELPELRFLELSYTVNDADVEFLRNHSRLEYLSLNARGLSDTSLGHIAQIETLTSLTLWGGGQPEDRFSMTGFQQLPRTGLEPGHYNQYKPQKSRT